VFNLIAQVARVGRYWKIKEQAPDMNNGDEGNGKLCVVAERFRAPRHEPAPTATRHACRRAETSAFRGQGGTRALQNLVVADKCAHIAAFAGWETSAIIEPPRAASGRHGVTANFIHAGDNEPARRGARGARRWRNLRSAVPNVRVF
jgi:hypothetical protein